MKTIAYSIADNQPYSGVREILIRITEKQNRKEDTDTDSIYYRGLIKLESEMEGIAQNMEGARVVVFIEDIDRCSPDKVLEVLESTKVLLGIRGFVYIIATNYRLILKLISLVYKESGIGAEQYLKDLVQVPLILPKHDINDITRLIEILSLKLDKNYSDLIISNKDLIAQVLPLNPIEVKRFINNFILINELYSDIHEVTPERILAVYGMRTRWPKFYLQFSSRDDFRELVKKYIKISFEERDKLLEELESEYHPPNSNESMLVNHKNDHALWRFLEISFHNIFDIKYWGIYQRVADMFFNMDNG